MKYENIFILHAYSASNSGDAKLVDLSIENIREILDEDITINIVAIDPKSFDYLKKGYPNIKILSIIDFIFKAFTLKPKKVLIIGVGGGYLRAGHRSESLKTLVAHGSQIIATKLIKNKKVIYFPQSIGPFKGVAGKILKHLVSNNIDVVFCRDDKSFSELKNARSKLNKDTREHPDLVVDRILSSSADERLHNTPIEGNCLVIRELQGKSYLRHYYNEIDKLISSQEISCLAVQAEARGNNDRDFYARNYPTFSRINLKDHLTNQKSLVISVRLHGSLESILAGHPSIHIAYERKGLSAFKHLGLDDFVFHCSDFDSEEVGHKIAEIRSDQTSYWSKIERTKRNHIQFSTLLGETIQ